MNSTRQALAHIDERPHSSILIGIGALLFVAAAGSLSLPTPFGGDQALFLVFAKELSKGAVLYRDYWDLKQPGIFWFYEAAGRTFGFSELGIHAFELIYMMALGMVLLIALRKFHTLRWAGALDVLLTIGAYYAVSRAHHLAQIEGLVDLPVFCSAWLAASAARSTTGRAWRLILSGLFGGIALLFKLILLPLLLAIWIASLIYALRRERKIALLATFSSALAFGMLLPLAATTVYFIRNGALHQLLYTTFEMPAAAARELPWRGFGNLVAGFLWFTNNFATLVALAFVGAYARLKRDADPLTINLCVWAVAGFGVILLQRFSWWDYHYLLLFVPIGVLAAAGIEAILIFVMQQRFQTSAKVLAFAATFALLLPIPVTWAVRAFDLARAKISPHIQPLLQYTPANGYPEARSETDFLQKPGSLPGNIFVFGNPNYYYISGRQPAIAMHGWAENTMTKTQWRMMLDELNRAQPVYIFIGATLQPIIQQGSKDFLDFMENNYSEIRQSPAGTWSVNKHAELSARLSPK